MEEEEMSDGEMDDLFMSKMGNYGIEPGVKKGKM